MSHDRLHLIFIDILIILEHQQRIGPKFRWFAWLNGNGFYQMEQSQVPEIHQGIWSENILSVLVQDTQPPDVYLLKWWVVLEHLQLSRF